MNLRIFIAFILASLFNAPAHADSFRVGALLPLSGDYAAKGAETKKGIELALFEKKDQFPELSVLFEDIGTLNNRLAVPAARKFLSEDKVSLALVGLSREAEPLAGLFQMNRVPLMILRDANDGILRAGNNIFSNGLSTEAAARHAASYSINNLKATRAAIVSHLDGWASVFSTAFKDEYQKLGGHIVFEEEMPTGSKDFNSVLKTARAAAPDVLVFPMVNSLKAFITEVKSKEESFSLLTAETLMLPDQLKAMGQHAKGIYYVGADIPHEDQLRALCRAHDEIDCLDLRAVSAGYEGMQRVFAAYNIAIARDISLRDALQETLGGQRTVEREALIYRAGEGATKD